jgi:DNA-binding XRE family transcriptional regulator
MAESSKTNLAKKMKQLREKIELSQEKLARLADGSNNTIIDIEAGKQDNPTIDTPKKVAKALNVSVEELI